MRGERGKRKERVGVVISDRMAKTRVVRVESLRRHPLYKKAVRQVKTLKAHDAENASRVGDVVLLAETRPLSKEKRWRIVRILEHRTLPAAVPTGEAEA
ncbi:MAG: 30S ribosomal protein S17 [Armatimonadota bacterium]|nr:30S ribosomal protein S17 [Armatimonadota bacterium]MDR7427935.1 30S ribosomal protein S17 [Armatimonadota bacterium]MDR7465262.1 30S ribosomal protein S17 [Armatimonadota bacterium]MDR7470409.1 30S ribosomal protein S17 [Armatimonadota bacterium]MDR7473491.1 30S ribosomal protein S17 [Armatimonadota bacterium]